MFIEYEVYKHDVIWDWPLHACTQGDKVYVDFSGWKFPYQDIM